MATMKDSRGVTVEAYGGNRDSETERMVPRNWPIVNVPPITHGLTVNHFFTKPSTDPEDEIHWINQTATIEDAEGKLVFKQEGIEAPEFWSNQAINIVASKYFRGHPGTPERENSIGKLIRRVTNPIADWGKKDGYFKTDADYLIFRNELSYIILHQLATFNSPVWFNVGVRPAPQCAACFILKIEDNMESILNWYKEEGLIFKDGSGAGINLSNLRSKLEECSDHGHASGPISFMKCADASAGVIKSGGKTRRAAKMVILDVDHPDIIDFINCKSEEEKKALVLQVAGYSGGMDGEATSSVFFQNANNSVRVTDEFMQAVAENGYYETKFRTTGKNAEFLPARQVFRQIAEAAWRCGDPGLQFDSTIQDWHTCPKAGRISASNPCSEYMHLDNSACNLASLNLLKFFNEKREFDIPKFKHVVDIMITAMDILVHNAGYPTAEIQKTAHDYRELGLGYANLGAAIMYCGLPYDSDEARDLTGAITSLMSGEAYLQSARLAQELGPFSGFEKDREGMLRVIDKHRIAACGPSHRLPSYEPVWAESVACWEESLRLAYSSNPSIAFRSSGFRNSQISLIAPTGTIAFMMDCDTTGMEPDIALVKYKRLSGGGTLKIVNRVVPEALKWLGYTDVQVKEIVERIREMGTIESDRIMPDIAVFDCAFKPQNGIRSISAEGHIKMMAAIQPFLSGAMSKTVNLPASATVEDIEQLYMLAWKSGLKSIAVYRDGSKTVQPMTTGKQAENGKKKPVEGLENRDAGVVGSTTENAAPPAIIAGHSLPKPIRHRLPDDAQSLRHKFEISGHKGYIHVGLYEDGSPGEVFVKMSKEGSTISGLTDAWATAISFNLQYGVPISFLVEKFSHSRFEPAGFTKFQPIPQAYSVIDYVARYLGYKFCNGNDHSRGQPVRFEEFDSKKTMLEANVSMSPTFEDSDALAVLSFAPHVHSGVTCRICGNEMIQCGTCYRCANCGNDTGCG